MADLSDEDPRVRALAVHDLGKMSDPQITAAIVGCLEDSSAEVRWQACVALVALGGSESLAGLMNAAADVDQRVRLTALQGLGRLRQPSAVSFLAGELNDADWKTRLVVVGALRAIGGPAAIPALAAAARDPTHDVRRHAMRGLGEVLPETCDESMRRLATEELRANLRHADPAVRLSAAIASTSSGDHRQLQAVREAIARERRPVLRFRMNRVLRARRGRETAARVPCADSVLEPDGAERDQQLRKRRTS